MIHLVMALCGIVATGGWEQAPTAFHIRAVPQTKVCSVAFVKDISVSELPDNEQLRLPLMNAVQLLIRKVSVASGSKNQWLIRPAIIAVGGIGSPFIRPIVRVLGAGRDCHPTVPNGDSFSRGFPGILNLQIRHRRRKSAKCVSSCAADGDIGPKFSLRGQSRDLDCAFRSSRPQSRLSYRLARLIKRERYVEYAYHRNDYGSPRGISRIPRSLRHLPLGLKIALGAPLVALGLWIGVWGLRRWLGDSPEAFIKCALAILGGGILGATGIMIMTV